MPIAFDGHRQFADGLLGARFVSEPAIGFDEVMERFEPWHLLRLSRLRARSPWLALAAGKRNIDVKLEPGEGVGVISTERSSDEWWQGLPKNMKDSVRKARKRCEREGGTDVVVSTKSNIIDHFELFLKLESSGWKGARGSDLSHSPKALCIFRSFLLASDGAQVRTLYIGGGLAASQVTVRMGRTLFLMKIAYEEQLAEFSPSNVLMADLVDACCEDPGVGSIDCLVWQPWHQRWGMDREPTYSLTAFNTKTVRGFARATWYKRRGIGSIAHRGPKVSHAAGYDDHRATR